MDLRPQDAQPSEHIAEFFQRHRTGLVTIVFTDLVDSTVLVQGLGDQAGATFLQRRRQIAREVLGGFPEGEEIETAGDSFLLAFSKPSDAARFALVLQAKFRVFSTDKGIPLQERIGIHLGEVVIAEGETEGKAKDLYGIQLTTASRVMSLAEGGQILLTRGVFDSARQVLKGEDLPGVEQLRWLSHGPYMLKGVDEPVEVCEVGEQGQRAFEAPKTSEKAKRQVRPDEEPVLGWRAAVGQEVPNTRWLLEEKLGEGGFGEVWMGRHQTLKERRVFKFCFRADRVQSLKREMTLFRVLKERIGDHPRIVRLLEVNFEEPPFYVVMDHVEGQDLRAWCEQQGGADRVPFPAKLEIVAQVAEALQVAHDAGVIHRDVKPGNVLISAEGSATRDEQGAGPSASLGSSLITHHPSLSVKLTDFGIGQVVSEEVLKGVTRAGFTQTMIADSSSSHAGSQLYMAPELLAGKPASTRSDIYSLGVVLYQLLVGDFARPVTTDWAKDVPDVLLQADLKRCFAGNPQERFAGAGQLAENLRALPQRRAERAEQVATMAAQAKAAYWRGVMRAAGAAAVIVLAMAALALWAIGAQRKARQMSETRRQELYVAQVNLAHLAWGDGNLQQAQTLLASQRPTNQMDLRGFEWRYLWRLCQDESRLPLGTFTDGPPSSGLSFSADGGKLAIADGKSVRVWDFAGRRELLTVAPHAKPVRALVFSPVNPGWLATADSDGIIRLWDLATNAPPAIFANDKPVNALAFSPDGQKLASASWDGEVGRVELWDVETRSRTWPMPGRHREGPALCLAFSPDGQCVASGGGDTKVRLWNATTGEPDGPPLEGHSAYVYTVDFSPDGRLLATGGFDARVLLWDMGTRLAGPELLGHKGQVAAVDFSPDGKTLVSGGADHTVRCWDVAASRQISMLRGHTSGVRSLAFSPDGRSLVSTGTKTIKLWDAPPHRSRDALTDHEGWVETAVLSHDGKTLATSDFHALAVKLWDVQSRSLITNLLGHTGVPWTLAFSPDGKFLASGSGGGSNGTVRLWDLSQHDAVAIHYCEFGIRSVTFSSDGRILGAAGNGLKFWNVASGRETNVIKGDTRSINRAAFSPQGTLLATTYIDGRVGVWDANDGKEVASFPGERPNIQSLSFSSDGRLVAVGKDDGSITLFDVSERKIIGRLQGHMGGVWSAAFTPDSKTLASASSDSTVRIWNLATGQTALTLQHLGPVTAVSFSDGGRLMATCGADATARLWPAAGLSEADGGSQPH